MSTPARNSSRPTKRFCPATWPASPQTPGLDAAIRELIELTTVPDCVKNAFSRIVEEFSLVRRERDKLLQENLLLRRRLGFPQALQYLLFPMLRLLAIPISSIHGHFTLQPVVASPISTRLARDEDR
ncbi:unnamed protein product [Heligmosomoides polygyrus]|uniref:Transposase n=1 Tax=Heligmosomoides polygyrus TaxID=6339 RepID=A0A183GL44_HELPZ|nr:unnamed protein product [Heligmosomoides polygyrus]